MVPWTLLITCTALTLKVLRFFLNTYNFNSCFSYDHVIHYRHSGLYLTTGKVREVQYRWFDRTTRRRWGNVSFLMFSSAN